MRLLYIFFMGAFCFGTQANAADADDFYTEVYTGLKLNQQKTLQIGGIVGYCPDDNLGIGVLFEQYTSFANNSARFGGLLGGADVRWFLEPFELSGLLGLSSESGDAFVVLGTGGAYLFALTPHLAARIELRAHLSSNGESGFFSNLGARLLF